MPPRRAAPFRAEGAPLRVLRIYHSAVVEDWRSRDRAMRAMGVDLALVTASRWVEGGSTVRFEPGNDQFAHAVRTYGKHPNLFVYGVRQMWRVFGSAAFDLLDFHEEPCSLAMAELLVLRSLKARRVPFVVYSAQNISKRYPIPFRWIERWCLRRASGAYPCNQAAARILESKGFEGTPAVLPLGVGMSEFSPAEREAPASAALRVGYVGRLSEHKGVDVLLEALTRTTASAEIAGDGPESARLHDLSHALGLESRVRFVGYLPRRDLAAFYRRLDVVVVPSVPQPGWDEQFCRVAVEAMACGVPVIASATGALPEVIGPGGILVPPSDPGRLAAALESIADPQRWTDLRTVALETAGRYDWEVVARQHVELYGRALSARTPAPRPAAVGERAVSIVVVAYGSPEPLRRTLTALDARHPVVVVDNSSSEATRQVCEELGARYLDPGRNVGFAAGVNIGIDSLRPARTDVLLLNPDAVISSDQIDDLQHCLRADGRTAAVSPSLVSPATNQSQRVMWPFPSPSYAWLTAIGLGRFSRRADFLIGAVLLLRAEAVTGIGVLDERYFLYAEEVDWQLRAHRAGWRVRHCPEITGAHVGAGTGGDPEWRDAMFHASAERFIRKWYGARGWASFRAAVVVREAVRSALFSGEARRAAKRRLGLYLRGPIDALASLPGPIDVN